MTQSKILPPEHGIESAFYSNGPYGLRPTMECLCGYQAIGSRWEALPVGLLIARLPSLSFAASYVLRMSSGRHPQTMR